MSVSNAWLPRFREKQDNRKRKKIQVWSSISQRASRRSEGKMAPARKILHPHPRLAAVFVLSSRAFGHSIVILCPRRESPCIRATDFHQLSYWFRHRHENVDARISPIPRIGMLE
jgi:hypothetical protein